MTKKRKIKSKRRRLTDRLDEVCRNIIRLRDNNQCQKCGKMVKGTDSHACHVVAKGGGASFRRWDLLNFFLGCTHCHFQFWHDNPLQGSLWFRGKFPARAEYLEIYQGGKPAKITTVEMEELYYTLKEKLNDLKNEKM